MNELKHDHKSHGDPNGGPIHHGQPPYWRRAHRDWRIWFCVLAVLAARVAYLMTGDLRWHFMASRSNRSSPFPRRLATNNLTADLCAEKLLP